MKNKLISEKLRELRKLHNYNQDDVAAALGVVRQTYSHYETGKRTPNDAILYKLSGLYKIPLEELSQVTIDIDRDTNFDAPPTTESGDELAKFLDFFSEPRNQKKYQFHTAQEKRLLYYFEKLSEKDKDEIIEFTKIKARNK